MSAFDPSLFLNATLNEPTERRDPVPVDNPEAPDKLYTARIDEVEFRPWDSKKPDAKVKSGMSMDVTLKLQLPPGLQSRLGLGAEFTLYDSVMLDLTPQGTLDNAKGRNNGLRAYREAVDLNKVGDSFAPSKLAGRVVKVRLKHEVWNNAPQERVAGILRA